MAKYIFNDSYFFSPNNTSAGFQLVIVVYTLYIFIYFFIIIKNLSEVASLKQGNEKFKRVKINSKDAFLLA